VHFYGVCKRHSEKGRPEWRSGVCGLTFLIPRTGAMEGIGFDNSS